MTRINNVTALVAEASREISQNEVAEYFRSHPGTSINVGDLCDTFGIPHGVSEEVMAIIRHLDALRAAGFIRVVASNPACDTEYML